MKKTLTVSFFMLLSYYGFCQKITAKELIDYCQTQDTNSIYKSLGSKNYTYSQDGWYKKNEEDSLKLNGLTCITQY